MIRLLTCIFLFTVGTSCIFVRSTKPAPEPTFETEVVTVFLTGNEFGALKPCGCSSGQLGGLERRAAVFNSVPESKRLIVDTGSLVESDGEQDRIKFNIMIQAFNLLDYDLVNLTEKDVGIARNLGLLNDIGSVFKVISAKQPVDANLPAKFVKRLLLKKRIVAVTVATFDTGLAPIEQPAELFTSRPGLNAGNAVNILILNRCDSGLVRSVAEMGIVDCLVCPGESDEAMVIGDPNARPLVVSVGQYGKYVGKLQIRADETTDRLNLSFLPVDVNENLPPTESLVDLYRDYQQLVKEEGLLEKYPRYALPKGLEYTGSKSCKYCHEYEYEKWSTKAHAHAYATLEEVGSQYDPECVICHVVGMEYESGFVSEEKTGHLKNVGCENCHGPGSEHIRTGGVAKTTGPRSACIVCHTPEHSAGYAGNKQLFLKKIIHWKEPNTPSDVK